MSGSQYLSSNKTSLFSVEDDVDDEEFLRHPPSGKSGYMLGSPENRYNSNFEELHQQRLEKQREIQSRMVNSTERSLSILRNSEEIGISTAEELMRQREQLERTEKGLDEINSTLRFSQKHIQGIKSVLGSFKNYLSGKTGEPQPNSSKQDSLDVRTSSTLLDAVEKTKPHVAASSQDHPGLRVRGLTEEQRHGRPPNDPEVQINANLDEMVSSISKLKGLAHGLGEEIESQNDLVENIISKTERADITIKRQNKDMNRLLK